MSGGEKKQIVNIKYDFNQIKNNTNITCNLTERQIAETSPEILYYIIYYIEKL